MSASAQVIFGDGKVYSYWIRVKWVVVVAAGG